MNAYEKRKEHRRQTQHMHTTRIRQHKLFQIEGVMHAYEIAFNDLNKTTCRMSYSNGWYYQGNKKMRQSEVINQTAHMLAQVHEQELDTPVDCL